ncbi:MAG TPA: GGDEF domain-containing protein [Usitatibacter sp.]|nr:GGDEF domain-containing protein [Usitatibacter sp.]
MQPKREAFDGAPGPGDTEVFAGKILEMLQLRSSEALPAWLGQKLATLYPPSRSRVLRVFPGAAARNVKVPRYAVFAMEDSPLRQAPHLVAIDALLIDAIREARPWCLVRNRESTRLLVTLIVEGEVRYVVELSGAFDPGDGSRIGAFASIASRYFERLVDAETDPLTRLSNRRAFHGQIETSLRRWAVTGRHWHFALLDIDHFKRINDEFGHLFGDEILVRFAQLLRDSFRAGDLIYRFGGEEFVAVYGVEQEEQGSAPLDRFRALVEGYEFPGVGAITVSGGHTRIGDASPTSSLIDRADRALYYAKHHGRNRICDFERLVAAGELEMVPPRRDVTIFD